MDILFIHGNYPGQFKHLCTQIGGAKTHRIIFMTGNSDIKESGMENIALVHFKKHREINPSTHTYLQSTEEAVLQGQAVIRAMNEVMAEGFNPKLVIFHGGMGLGLFLRDLLPNSVLIGYFEWWFKPETTKNLVQDYDFNQQLTSGMRNLPILKEIEICNTAVIPTQWQKDQFPEVIQNKLNVIFDGIDTSFFHEPPEGVDNDKLVIQNNEEENIIEIGKDAKILSYATRGMEPLRGFPEFMRALPHVFEKTKNLVVIIAGRDRCAYSYKAPTHKGSWKEKLMDEIKDRVPCNQIHFTGLLTYIDYRSLLWRTDLHCYFTRPYVTSWSLFEAASCNARLLTNKVQATSNIAKEGTTTFIDLDNQNDINIKMAERLNDNVNGKSNRAKIRDGFELYRSNHLWERLINDALIKVRDR